MKTETKGVILQSNIYCIDGNLYKVHGPQYVLYDLYNNVPFRPWKFSDYFSKVRTYEELAQRMKDIASRKPKVL